MQIRYHRVEEGNQHYSYFVDPETGKGFMCGASPDWEWVHLYSTDEPSLKTYMPRDVPDREFNTLYDRLAGQGQLSKVRGTLDPRETPGIRTIVEEDLKAYLQLKIGSMQKTN